MPWNPDTYNKFKTERYQPFYDLLALVAVKPNVQIVDLGCGTGELTATLAEALPGSTVTGIDASPDMLRDAAQFANKQVTFRQQTIEDFTGAGQSFDIIFSNAAVQWVDDHAQLLPKLLRLLNPGGQLAIQVPASDSLFTHRAMRAIADTEPFREALGGYTRVSPVLDIEQYARILFEAGCTGITVFEKIYPHALENEQAVYDWTAGTALIRYLELLPETLKDAYINEYKKRLAAEYGQSRPVFYPYRRILIAATTTTL